MFAIFENEHSGDNTGFWPRTALPPIFDVSLPTSAPSLMGPSVKPRMMLDDVAAVGSAASEPASESESSLSAEKTGCGGFGGMLLQELQGMLAAAHSGNQTPV
jgi:hypothetical protein